MSTTTSVKFCIISEPSLFTKYFELIDACGNDFTIRPITNCGKGDPMQSMIMGNGGPSIRGIATVKSVN